MDAVKLRVGEHIQRMGGVGVVVAVVVTPGAAVRYNLTVRNLHTFAVGSGQWVVHNCGGQVAYGSTDLSKATQGRRISDASEFGKTYAKGGNYGAAQLEDGSIITGRSNAVVHAEEDLLAQAGASRQKIVALYSEYEPCASRCTSLLNNSGVTDVTWSFPFNGVAQTIRKQVRDAAINALFQG